MTIRLKTAQILVAVFMVVLGAIGTSASVLAAPSDYPVDCPNIAVPGLGRNFCYGFFTNVGNYGDSNNKIFPNIFNYKAMKPDGSLDAVPHDWSFPQDTDTANSATNTTNFIDYMSRALNRQNLAVYHGYPNCHGVLLIDQTTSTNCNDADARWEVGAAFIIETMLGRTAGDFANNRAVGIQRAKTDFAEWATLVKSYNSQNLIQWHATLPQPNGSCKSGGNDGHFNSTSISSGNDVAVWCNTNLVGADHYIIFKNSNGSTYVIDRSCANTDGIISPIPDMNMAATLAGPANNTQVRQDQSITLTAGIQNNGDGPSDLVYLELAVQQGNGDVVRQANTQSVVDAPYGVSQNWSNTGCSAGYPPQGCTPPHWYWGYQGMKQLSQNYPQQVTFKVNANAANGDRLCFQADAVRRSRDSNININDNIAFSRQLCYTVVVPRDPSIHAGGSDIHAGGGLCGSAQINGTVNGFPAGQSLGDYVVSASGAISDFGSGGLVDGTTMSLGSAGHYNQVCRDDLLAMANRDLVARGATGTTPPPAGSLGLYDWTLDHASGVYVYNGEGSGVLKIHGMVSNKVTIIARSGSIQITNDVTLDPALKPRTGDTTPTLGVIASGNISIMHTAHTVNAYMFANGTINTCDGWNAAVCNTTLTVNGFLMANALAFQRFGPPNAEGSTYSEVVTMTPQLYLNPPKYFDAATVDSYTLQGQGEKQPLF